jgi:hypothetical protein
MKFGGQLCVETSYIDISLSRAHKCQRPLVQVFGWVFDTVVKKLYLFN